MAKVQIMAINAGSSSLKFSIYDVETGEFILSGSVTGIGESDSTLILTSDKDTKKIGLPCDSHQNAWEKVFQQIREKSLKISYFVHRVVHGGKSFISPVELNETAIKKLQTYIPLAPNHLPYELSLIETIQYSLPQVIQYACFDTAFHANMPQRAKILSIPHSLFEEGIQKYGFHGLSYEFISTQIDFRTYPKVVVAHLGHGASCSAIHKGKGVDTTMGFSPTGGLIMSNRSGDLDPGILLYLLREKKMNHEKLESVINQESGLLGISGVSGDMQTLLQSNNPNAKLAVEMFCFKASQYIAAMAVSLRGIDLLVFTGGIGEHAHKVRKEIAMNLSFLGLGIDTKKNEEGKENIASSDSSVAIQVISTNENRMLIQHALDMMKKGS